MVTTKLLTATDLWNLQTDELQDFELFEGELIPMSPTGGEHGELQMAIGSLLRAFVMNRNAGKVFSETGFVLDSGQHTVFAPDVSFVAASRLPDDRKGYLQLAPDLAVEVISPSNNPGEIERKIATYLLAGVRLIWVVYPDQKQVVAHAPGDAPRVFGLADTVPGDDVLPGLAIPVADIFS